MIIKNVAQNKPYQLEPDTQMKVERTNPFLNEYGEQTLPITLPYSAHNRKLLEYPGQLGGLRKPSQQIEATIQDGEYFTTCRQAILGVNKKDGISTSFYMNEGAFFADLKDARLFEIFADEVIPGVNTVAEGVAFCRGLINEPTDEYAIFPIWLQDGDKKRIINELAWMDSEGNELEEQDLGNNNGCTLQPHSEIDPVAGSSMMFRTLYNKAPTGDYTLGHYYGYPRKITSDDQSVNLSEGYFITPFVKATYLLKRIFSHYNYTLNESFLDHSPAFSNMVFVNNTADALVNGTILLTDLLPDCNASTILEVFRKKFCCEFIPDVINRTVEVKLFNDILTEDTDIDLTDMIASALDIDFTTQEKSVVLQSEETINAKDSYEDLEEVVAKYPKMAIDGISGMAYRDGFKLGRFFNDGLFRVREYLGDNIPYTQHPKEEHMVKVPDCAIAMDYEVKEMTKNINLSAGISNHSSIFGNLYPSAGSTRYLNSTVILNITTAEDNQEANEDAVSVDADNDKQYPMLCFHYNRYGLYTLGTTTNYSIDGDRLWDYSLQYNGPDGIFERFYRKLDDILRNSFYKVKADVLLDQSHKISLPAHRKVIIDGQELIIDKLSFTVGGKNEPVESEFYTIRAYDPQEHAPSQAETYDKKYVWNLIYEVKNVTTQAELSQEDVMPSEDAVFYTPPTQEQYEQQQTKTVLRRSTAFTTDQLKYYYLDGVQYVGKVEKIMLRPCIKGIEVSFNTLPMDYSDIVL